MILFAAIPVVFYYATPIIPIAVIFFYVQNWAGRISKKALDQNTSHTAAGVVKKMLQSAEIEDISVEEWDNYSENEYTPQERKIYLSPNALVDKDVSAIAVAAREAGLAIFDRQSPGTLDFWKLSSKLFTASYWTVAIVLLFGFLTGSVITIGVGYGFCVISVALFFYNLSMESRVNKITLQHLESLGILEEGKKSEFHNVLKANALLW